MPLAPEVGAAWGCLRLRHGHRCRDRGGPRECLSSAVAQHRGRWQVAPMGRKLGVAAGILAVVLAAPVVAIQMRNRALGDRLVGEVVTLSRERPRPVHRAGATPPGTFEDCLGPLLDRAPDAGMFSSKQGEEVKKEIAAARDGTKPLDSLRPEVQSDLQRLVPWAVEVAECARAAAVGDAPGLGPFGDWDHPRQKVELLPGSTAPRLLVLAMRADVAKGEAASALRRCADVLALARDLVMDKGLVGAMLAQNTTKVLVPACVSAIDESDVGAKRQFLGELAIIRRGMPTFQAVMEIEHAEMQLIAFGKFLSAEQVMRLPDTARPLAKSGLASFDSPAKRVAAWLHWGAFVNHADQVVASAASPNRDAELAGLDKGYDLLDRFLSDGMPPTSILAFAQRYDGVARGLDLLECAAQVSLGGAPLASVKSSVHDGATTLEVPWWKEETLSVELRAESPPR